MVPEGFCRWDAQLGGGGHTDQTQGGAGAGGPGREGAGETLTPGGLGVSGGAERGCEPQRREVTAGEGPVSIEGGGIIFTFS